MSGKTVDKLTVTDLGVSVPGRQLVESLNISAPGGEIIAVPIEYLRQMQTAADIELDPPRVGDVGQLARRQERLDVLPRIRVLRKIRTTNASAIDRIVIE